MGLELTTDRYPPIRTNYHQPAHQSPTQVGKRRQSTSHIEKTNAASRETRQFGIYDQLKVELRKEDPRTLKHPIERSVKSFLETTYLEQEAFGSKSQVSCHSTPPGCWCQVFRHAVPLTGRYETLSIVVRKVCNAMCE